MIILLCVHILPLATFAFFSFFITIEYLNSLLNIFYIPYKYLQPDDISDVYIFTTKYLSLDYKTLKYIFIYMTPSIILILLSS